MQDKCRFKRKPRNNHAKIDEIKEKFKEYWRKNAKND
jgi:hypothetical protein